MPQQERYFELIVRVSDDLINELYRDQDGPGTEEDAIAAEVTRTGVVVTEITEIVSHKAG
jgi:hypothetical protein